jgi:hypothetical protein
VALQPLRCRACVCAALALLGLLAPACISGERASAALAPPGEGDLPVIASAGSGAPIVSGANRTSSSGSSLFITPGDMHELRSLGQDCTAIAEEPRCLGVSENAVVMFGTESGRYCTRPVSEPLPINGRRGMPTSLVWRPHDLAMCADIGDPEGGDEPTSTLLVISLDDGAVQHFDVDCTSVVSWEGRQLLLTPTGAVGLFNDYGDAARSWAGYFGTFLPLVASASDGDELYALGDDGSERTIARSRHVPRQLDVRARGSGGDELRRRTAAALRVHCCQWARRDHRP